MGFLAYLNYSQVKIRQRVNKGTYDGEDIRSLVCHIIDVLAILGALGITRDHIRWNTVELLESEGDLAIFLVEVLGELQASL